MSSRTLVILIFFYLFGTYGCSRSIFDVKTEAVRADDLLITLTRTECYGKCPVYELTIDADGNITFDGIKHTTTLGKAQGKVNRNEVEGLILEFNKVRFMDLDNNYDQKTCPEFATDMSTVSVSLRQNGNTKKITHNLGCSTKGDHKPYPPGLRGLEAKIDETAHVSRWVEGGI